MEYLYGSIKPPGSKRDNAIVANYTVRTVYSSAVPTARDRILDAAEARLLAGGPAALVLDAVASDAGVSKGGLLYHFGSKEALVAGLCERMFERFEQQLTALCEADPEPRGAWTRAYLASTVTVDGKPADDSARLMAAILSTLGRDSRHLQTVRSHFARWHARLEADGIDPKLTTIVRLASDGLWLTALLGLEGLEGERGAETVRALRAFTAPDTAK
jgi:AcrR family transcriptional regulator